VPIGHSYLSRVSSIRVDVVESCADDLSLSLGDAACTAVLLQFKIIIIASDYAVREMITHRRTIRYTGGGIRLSCRHALTC